MHKFDVCENLLEYAAVVMKVMDKKRKANDETTSDVSDGYFSDDEDLKVCYFIVLKGQCP